MKPDSPDPLSPTDDHSTGRSVSRETEPGPPAVEAVPSAAVDIFGDGLGLAQQYADRLATEATVRGLIGPSELSRIWSRHLVNCAVLAELIPEGAQVLDIGSGAGLPGIPLAIARPDLTVTLVEPLLRRSSWLDQVVGELGLTNVTVHRARAEDIVGALSADVVTARAVAPMDRLARWCLPLVSPGGQLLAMKGQGAQAELAVAAPLLRGLRAVDWDVQVIGVGRLVDPTSVIRVRVGSSAAPTRRTRAGRSKPGRSEPGMSRPRGRGDDA